MLEHAVPCLRVYTAWLLLTLLLPGIGPQAGGTATIHLNFQDTDIREVITLMSEITGKNFLVDEQVRGKVTMVAPKPMSVEEAYQVFLSMLEMQGYTAVLQGPIIKIIPSKGVKERPLPVIIDHQRPVAAPRD
jgi:general secretion pathway protein D